MHLTRTLLNHRGVDDELATYVTDYILSFVVWMFGTHLLYIKLKSNITARDCHRKVDDNMDEKSMKTYVVILIMYTFCCISLLAGLVHQFLQTVEPYTTWTDNWSWLIVWRFASAISCILDGGFIVLALQILADEKIFLPSRKQFFIGYSLLACFIGVKFVYSLAKLSHPIDPWSLRDDFLITFICVLIGLVMIVVACCTRTTSSLRDVTRSSVTSSATNEVTLTLDSGDISRAENSSTTSSYVVEHRSEQYRIHLYLNLIGYISFLCTGVAYFIFKDLCDEEKSVEERKMCPFSTSFNKNAWFHLALIPVFALFYFGELLSIRRRRRSQI